MRTPSPVSGIVCAALFVGLAATPARAASFDFTTLNLGVEGILPTSVVVQNVTADAFADTAGNGVYAPAPMWLRNVPNDHGLGVCSEGESLCASGGGDQNEVSQLIHNEVIRFDKDGWDRWTELWVSSLDAAGTDGGENGILYWSDNPSLAGPFLGSAVFTFGDFGASVEGNILTLPALAALDPTARYLFFRPGSWVGANEDYLVWKGAVEENVPEPATLLLFGTGLAVLAARARRRR